MSIVPGLVALAALGAAAACSSSSAPGPAAPEPDAGTGGDGGVMGTPDVLGKGMACPPQAHETVGAKVQLTVTWPATLANAGCDNSTKDSTGKAAPCKGTINIWLLAKYDFNGNDVTGTTYTCGNETPPIPLSPTGSMSEGLPAGQQATVDVQFPATVWQAILGNSAKKPTATTGKIGGWNIGSSFRIDPTNSVYGLADSSTYASDKTVWPGSESALTTADLADDDMDGHPGITGVPSTANGYSLPATAAMFMPPYPPQADQLYLALRTELSLYGTSMTDCNTVSGSAAVQLLNNHVVGCHIAANANNGVTARECTMGEWDFIDSNSTVYLGPGVHVPAGQMPASYAPPGISGTFTAKVLSTDPDSGTVDCSTVLSTFP